MAHPGSRWLRETTTSGSGDGPAGLGGRRTRTAGAVRPVASPSISLQVEAVPQSAGHVGESRFSAVSRRGRSPGQAGGNGGLHTVARQGSEGTQMPTTSPRRVRRSPTPSRPSARTRTPGRCTDDAARGTGAQRVRVHLSVRRGGRWRGPAARRHPAGRARDARGAPLRRLGHGALTRLTRRPVSPSPAFAGSQVVKVGYWITTIEDGGSPRCPRSPRRKVSSPGGPEGLLGLPSRRARRVRRPSAAHGLAVVHDEPQHHLVRRRRRAAGHGLDAARPGHREQVRW